MPRNPSYDWDKRRIISVDGEGQLFHSRHAYTLLAAADDRGFRDFIEHDGNIRAGTGSIPYGPDDVAPNHGLPTKQCLDFLLTLPKHKSDIITSFSFTYDVTKILQDLPLANLQELAKTNETVWRRYRIGYLPRKYLEISHDGRSVTVHDTFSFWQMSFVKALMSSRELFTPEQIRSIDCRPNDKSAHICDADNQPCMLYMKDHREQFDNVSPELIREYCYTECKYLSIIFRDFLRNMSEMKLPVTRYSLSGPGGVAQGFFALEHLRVYMPAANNELAAPGLPINIPLLSYYGGRFEISMIGPVGDVIGHDKHSAYPAAAVANLPCLRCGRFERVDSYQPGELGFYLVGSRTSGPWAPFPFRVNSQTKYWFNDSSLKKDASPGSIAFVHGGMRWVTSFEVETARHFFGDEAIPVYKGYIYRTPCKHKPFKRISELYLLRKEGNPSEGLSKIIKLLLNSIYGKLAQTIGVSSYRCHIWAGWITGATRAAVLSMALRAPEDVVSIATDGILTRRPIPQDSDSSVPSWRAFKVTHHDLGTWDQTEHQDCWLGMPGIYGFGSNDKDDKAYKRRGLDRNYFPISHLRATWERGQWAVNPVKPVRAFMPFRLAVQRTNSLDVLGEWPEMPKTIKFTSIHHKRTIPDDIEPMLPHTGEGIRLGTITIPDNLMSEPYDIIEHETHLGDLDMPMWEPNDLEEQ